MTAKIINGKEIAAEMRAEITTGVEALLAEGEPAPADGEAQDAEDKPAEEGKE